VLSGLLLLAPLLAGQASLPTPAGPPEPEIVTLAPTPTPSASRPFIATPAVPTPTPTTAMPTATAVPAATAAPATAPLVQAAPAAAPPAPVVIAPAPPVRTLTPAPAADTGRVPVLKSRDRAGKTPVYAIHFSSFQKRENSERDAAALAKRLKLPARPVAIDLGAKGTWYRTMVGEFPTADDARRAFAALPEDLARTAGFVYRIQGP
jgi:hypothetical protein